MGQVRVGRCVWSSGSRVDPEFSGFTRCLVLTKSSTYGSLSPYGLKDDNGRIMENIWQFSKCYETVPKTTERFSRWNNRIIWKWHAERHVIIGQPYHVCREYRRWRKAGMACKDAVRYPVGYQHRTSVPTRPHRGCQAGRSRAQAPTAGCP